MKVTPNIVAGLSAAFAFTTAAHAATQTYQDSNILNTWNTTDSNWSGGQWVSGNDAVFSGTGEAVTIGTVSAHNIDINSSGYSFTGGALTLTGATPTITANADVTMNTGITASTGFTKAGNGKLTLNGALSNGGTTNVTSGTLNYNLDVIGNVGIVNIGGGSTVELFRSVNDFSARSAMFTGSGNLNKEGAGNFVLNGTGILNGFTGTLHVNGGTLIQQGAATSTVGNFAVDIAKGATLDLRTEGGKYGTLTDSGTIGVATVDKSSNFNGITSTLSLGNDNGTGTFSGIIKATQGTLHLDKEGVGTQTLSGNNTYNGTTSVNAGTLRINGTNSGTGAVNVAASATLGGTGSVAGAVNVTGILAPGASIESLGTGAVTFNNGSTLAYELNSTPGGLNGDLVDSTGTLTLNGTVTLSLSEVAGVLTNGSKLTLISYTGASAGTGWNGGLFTYLGNTVTDDSVITLGSNQWRFNYNDLTGGTNFTSDQTTGGNNSFVTMTVVPEPSIALLGGFGLLALLRRRRK